MAFPYVRANADWKDADSALGGGDESTPITATALDTIEAGIESLSDILENADAAGDLLAASGADAWTRLAKGADDEVLSVAAGALDYRKIVNAMVDAAADIAVSKLAASATANDVLTTVGGVAVWQAPSGGALSLTAALPGSPSDGDEIILTDNLSAGTYHWHLRYVAARSSNKWVFVGGSPATAYVATSETSSSTTYTDLATSGPSITVPVAGDYVIEFGTWLFGDTNPQGTRASFSVGSTTATDADSIRHAGVNTDDGSTGSALRTKSGVAASDAITVKYRVEGGTGTFQARWLKVTPIALGG